MTYEDKWKAKCIIHRIFVFDTSEIPESEIMRQIGNLALLDLTEEDYKEVMEDFDRIMAKRRMMHQMCHDNLKKSIMG